ncbi:hypothetical protein BC629DRAFT_1598360 [Irpex lacteus]|nr:hypothetical protein BC629DRAFT_1598360 [Irpex lacteus]
MAKHRRIPPSPSSESYKNLAKSVVSAPAPHVPHFLARMTTPDMSTVASVAHDDLKTRLSETDYITSLEAFMQRVEDMVKLAKTPEDPGYAEYIQTVDTITLLYACLDIKQKVTTLPRPPYDPFVEAMRRRALVELQEQGRSENKNKNKNKDRTAKPRGSAKAKTKAKAKRPRVDAKAALSSPTLYALSRLDEDHRKYHQPGQENEGGDVEMKTEDMKACAALVAEIRLYVEGLTIERWQRQSFEDALRCDGRLVGEGSSSGAGVETGMRGGSGKY